MPNSGFSCVFMMHKISHRLSGLLNNINTLSWTSLVAQMVESSCNAGDPDLIPGVEDPLEKEMATHSSILAGKSHGQRSLAG